MRQFIENYPYGSNRGSITPLPPDYVDARILGANAAERHAIPDGANFVSFSANVDFYAKFGNSSVDAAVPSGDVTNGSASELNPMARRIPGGGERPTHVSLISPSTGVVTLSFWA